MFLLSGLLLGFVGSLHCIGMCGPIILAISSVDNNPDSSGSVTKLIIQRVFYHLGRALTYGVMGALFGVLGSHIKLSGMQQGASILIGSLIVIWILLPSIIKSKFSNFSLIKKYNEQVKNVLSLVLRSGKSKPFLVIGLINGFLPCGLVYAGLAGAVTTGDALDGFIYMFLFGLGTIPALFAFSFVPALRKYLPKFNSRKIIPALSFVLGITFILRGLNLGIPFVSPKFEDKPQTEQLNQPDCCK
jgi:sulfite exporter TauE/SafE